MKENPIFFYSGLRQNRLKALTRERDQAINKHNLLLNTVQEFCSLCPMVEYSGVALECKNTNCLLFHFIFNSDLKLKDPKAQPARLR